MNRKIIILLLGGLFCAVGMTSCGKDNVLSSLYKENNKEKAEDEIANGNYDSAISLLETYISANPADYSAQSMLANAYMLKAGIDLLTIIIDLSHNIDDAKNNFYAILHSFPRGTQTNINYINTALQTLSAIPSSALTSDQIFQTAMANVALAFFTTSKDILDSSGAISTTLVESMSVTDADTIYNSLVNVQTNFISLGVVAGSGSGTGIILDIINQITSTGGSTGPEKLATFLIANA
ncbi:MAG: hypothetical protein V4591_11415 [Bdellovibrionota bacterium]